MSEVKTCPKCGSIMVQGDFYTTGIDTTARIAKTGEPYRRGDAVISLYCENCGYVELYKEMKEKKE